MKLTYQTNKKERFSCCLFFLGQNILWDYVETFLTDIGIAAASAAMILLAFYKLRTKDVQIMSRYNNGETSREEAEAALAQKYGPAGAR